MAEWPSDSGSTVAIIGAGMVGSSCAYALMQRGIATEIILVDADTARAEGEAMDLSHGVPFVRPCHIRAGSYSDLSAATVVVITAGANQRPGESRLDLLQRNAAIMRGIVPQVVASAPNAIILIATNPVDILTQIAYQAAGQVRGHVFGSGTILDTARLRYLLGQHYQVDPHSVHAYIVGEHGDSSLPLWSLAHIGGVPLRHFQRVNGQGYDATLLAGIFAQARDAAYEIIKRKHATYYAIGLGLVTIIEAILRDQHTVLTVSSPFNGEYGIEGVSTSMPSIIGRNGVEEVLNLILETDEMMAFRNSAAILSERFHQLSTA